MNVHRRNQIGNLLQQQEVAQNLKNNRIQWETTHTYMTSQALLEQSEIAQLDALLPPHQFWHFANKVLCVDKDQLMQLFYRQIQQESASDTKKQVIALAKRAGK